MATGKRVFAVKPADLKAAEKLTKEIGQRIQKLHNIMARTTGLRPSKLTSYELKVGPAKARPLAKISPPKGGSGPYNPNPIEKPLLEVGTVLCNEKTHHGVLLLPKQQICKPVRC